MQAIFSTGKMSRRFLGDGSRNGDRLREFPKGDAVKRFQWKKHVTRQDELYALRHPANQASRNVVAAGVRVDYFDPAFTHITRDAFGAEDPERISNRRVEDIFRREKVEFRLPLIRRPENDVDFVSPTREFAAQIDKMALAAAKGFADDI